MPCGARAYGRLRWAILQELTARDQQQKKEEMAQMVADLLAFNEIEFTVDKEAMKANPEVIKYYLKTEPLMNIAVGPDNTMTVITVDGSFEMGKEKIEAFVEQLEALDDNLRMAGFVESHVHDGEGQAPQQAYAQDLA